MRLIKKYEKIFLVTVGVIVSISLLLLNRRDVRFMISESAAERWSDSDYSQISLFCAYDEKLDYKCVENIRNKINKKLSEGRNRTSNTSHRWYDAFAGEKDVQIERNKTSIKVSAVYVGGEFFRINEWELLDGCYPDLSKNDEILLDEGSAWALFGSTNISGLCVSVDGKSYTVSGVIKGSEGKSEFAYGDLNRVYICIGDSIEISWYSIVIPEYVPGYGKELLVQVLMADENDHIRSVVEHGEIVVNSDRFKNEYLLKQVLCRKQNSVRSTGIKYPFWEMAVRFKTEIIIKRYFVSVIMITVSVIITLISLAKSLISKRIRMK